jgi:hypothetical protein
VARFATHAETLGGERLDRGYPRAVGVRGCRWLLWPAVGVTAKYSQFILRLNIILYVCMINVIVIIGLWGCTAGAIRTAGGTVRGLDLCAVDAAELA